MRNALTTLFLIMGFIGLFVAVGMSCYSQMDKHTHPMQPNGWVQDERRTFPLAVTGAGLAVFSGLCFLSAAVVNSQRHPRD